MFFAGILVSLSSLEAFLICVTKNFNDKLDVLITGTSLSDLYTFMIFRKTFGFGVNLSDVTLYDDLDREDFDRGELISMTGEKC